MTMCLRYEQVSISLTTDTSKRKGGFFYIYDITFCPLYKSCCNSSYTIPGALSGMDWRMIHGSCLLCSMSLLFHTKRAV